MTQKHIVYSSEILFGAYPGGASEQAIKAMQEDAGW